MSTPNPRNVLDTLDIGDHMTITAGTPTLADGEPLTITLQVQIPFDTVENLDELDAFLRPWVEAARKAVRQAWER